MNSLIQCLFFCREFRENLLKENVKSSNSFLMLLKRLFEQLKNYKKNFFPAKELKEYLNNYDLFNNDKGADITDLFDLIFSSIAYDNKDEDSLRTVKYEEKYYDKKAMFEEIKKEVDFKLIINKYFLGFYESEYKCKGEKKHFRYVFQNEYRMIFPLEEVAQYYNRKDKNLTIIDFFEYNKKHNINNLGICPECKTKFSLSEKIYKIPKILIIILDRGKNKRYKKSVEFDEEIDLTNYIDEDENKNNSNMFKLIGVSSHIGNSGLNGHYISYCLCDDNNYYCFNDSYVKIINRNKASIKKFNQLFEGSPYVLFYENFEKKNQANPKIENLLNIFKNNYKIYNTLGENIIEKLIENIYLLLKEYSFNILQKQQKNSIVWGYKDNYYVTMSIKSKSIKFILYTNYNKKDKSDNNTSEWEHKFEEINSYQTIIDIFKKRFRAFFIG